MSETLCKELYRNFTALNDVGNAFLNGSRDRV